MAALPDEDTILALARPFVQAHAVATAAPPGEYPGSPSSPDVVVVSVAAQDGAVTAWFGAEYAIRYGGQAGSDWYLHVVVCGRLVLAPDGAVAEGAIEVQQTAHVSEWEYERTDSKAYDGRRVRDGVIAQWRPSLPFR